MFYLRDEYQVVTIRICVRKDKEMEGLVEGREEVIEERVEAVDAMTKVEEVGSSERINIIADIKD